MAVAGWAQQLARQDRRSGAERHRPGMPGLGASYPDVDDDDGYIVRRSGILGQGDELTDGIWRILRGHQRATHVPGAYDRTQPVRTDQVTITGAQLAEAEIRRPLRLAIEIPRKHRSQDGLSTENKVAHDVILGDLSQLATPEPERAGVADMNERSSIARPEHCRQGSAHASPGRVLGRSARYLGVGLSYSPAESLEQNCRVNFGITRTQRLDYRGAGDIAGSVAAHSVGNRVQPPPRIG